MVGRNTTARASRSRARALAAIPAITLMGSAVVAIATAQPAAAATTFWALEQAPGDCTQSRPCSLDDAVTAVNAAGGGTLTLLGDANNPFHDARVILTGPTTIEAAPGATPVLVGFGTAPVISSDEALTVDGVDLYNGSYGISADRSVSVVNSYVHDNVQQGVNAVGIDVRNSTIANNGTYGISGARARIFASTIAGNHSVGVDASLPSTVVSSTVKNNGRNFDTGTITIAGSIISGGQPNCSRSSNTDLGGNISDDATCGLNAASSVENSATLRTSLKGLDFNGGTPTVGLSAGSPAIGMVPGNLTADGSVVCAQPDQRGLPRPASACDAGAYQSGNAITVTVTAPSDTTAYGDSFPYLQPSDPSGTRLRVAPTCASAGNIGSPVGTYPVTCSGAKAGPDVTFVYVDGTRTITKGYQTITASSATMALGGPVPTITPIYDDNLWVFGTEEVETPPVCTTTATPSSPPGNYPSSCRDAVDDNYAFDYFDGVVQVRDLTRPIVTIDSGPSGTVASPDATFTFSSNEPGSTFICRLDGPANRGGTPVGCSSPKTYLGLADGNYSFIVSAQDAAGNNSLLKGQSFTVDTTPPDTSITSGPSGTVGDGAAAFGFTTQGGVGFQCKLDGPGGAGTFGSCTSPTGYSGLADGAYTFSVRSLDAAGNIDATPATRPFTVDATPPDTTIESGTSGLTNHTSASFTFSSPAAGAGFECKLDGPAGLGTFGSCASPATYSASSDGTYTFSVRAINGAGKADPTPATRSFTVDTAPPVITIVSPGDGVVLAQGATVYAQYSCSDTLGGGSGVASCSGPTATGAAIDTSSPGTHAFTVTATDNAGNSAIASAVYIVRAAQSISWAQQGPYAYGHAPVALTASATSGLPVEYAVSSGPCLVSGSTLTITGVGVCALTASQAGDASHLPATPVSRSITITRAPTQLVAAPARVGLLQLTFKATLTSTVTGTPIAGQKIDFSRQGVRTCSGTTDGSGVATCAISGLFLVLGHLGYTATYAGNSNYLPSRGDN